MASAETNDEKLGSKMGNLTIFNSWLFLPRGGCVDLDEKTSYTDSLCNSCRRFRSDDWNLHGAITGGMPVLGVETEADPFATIAKILQDGIISIMR